METKQKETRGECVESLSGRDGSVVSLKKRTRSTIEWVAVVGVGIAVALIVRTVVFQAFYIPSGSMKPLIEKGDRILVNKVTYRFSNIHRGDVVVFTRPPGESDTSITHLIKRVIGLPGDTLESFNGVLYVNGVPQHESYLPDDATTVGLLKTVVPKGMLWVMGDNRNVSADSRFFGAIDQDTVVGRADVLVWPINEVGFL